MYDAFNFDPGSGRAFRAPGAFYSGRAARPRKAGRACRATRTF
jgi:hypothetical protein